MSKYIVTGGVPLKGTVKIFGAKNAAFKLMIAAALSDQPSKISNICYIRDVIGTKKLLERMGVKVNFEEEKSLVILAKDLKTWEIPAEFGHGSRASSMILPILLHRFKKAKVPLPGGDQIGTRSLDRHLNGLRALGVEVAIENNFINAKAPVGLIGNSYTFSKNTHTGTETMIMAACLASGETILHNVAEEPEINDLINFLNSMGADIGREPNRIIRIRGVSSLRGGNWLLMPDRNEAVTFACAALASGGDIFVESARADHLGAFLEKVNQTQGGYEIRDEGIRFFSKGSLMATSIETAPHPGFMTDWQALWTTLMTQASGESVVHERVFEDRFGFVSSLKAMGANIDLFNPPVENPNLYYNFNLDDIKENSFHAAKVVGPTPLHARSLMVDDIRAGATLTLAALIAQGQSVIENVELIERGYENLEGRLESLGAQIVKRD